MMYLLFQCQSCNHKFSTIDEMEVTCPECKKSNVKVLWERGATKQDYEDLKKLMEEDNQTIIAGDTQDQLVYNNVLGDQEYYIYFDNGIVTAVQDEQ